MHDPRTHGGGNLHDFYFLIKQCMPDNVEWTSEIKKHNPPCAPRFVQVSEVCPRL